ncbi:MAG: SDR family NAD(P)-dependent oxidoreductase, partial [Pirellulales bacterium]|nr:SDR family NAD(P)-dependent oxidoreductase [Pirellulales bacterium]
MSYWLDKVVIVTGASAGFGRVLAERFARAGATVVLAARSIEKLDQAALAIREIGGQVLALSTDVTDKSSVEDLIRTTVDRFGRIDAVVNNAGASMRGAIDETTDRDFAQLIDLNLISIVNSTRAALPHLLVTGGHVVNIGSLAAKTASPYLGAYPASKFAVAAYSQQLRLEMNSRGLHVLLVCPGP